LNDIIVLLEESLLGLRITSISMRQRICSVDRCDGTCFDTREAIHDAAQNPIGYGVTWVRRTVFNCAPVWKGTLERMPSIARTVSPSIIVLLIFECYSGEWDGAAGFTLPLGKCCVKIRNSQVFLDRMMIVTGMNTVEQYSPGRYNI